jgi:hypothetical protein
MELLNQMDGFDQTVNVKVIMATNRADTLDPALLRPGRLDRKIEFPLPDRRQKRLVFQVRCAERRGGRVARGEEGGRDRDKEGEEGGKCGTRLRGHVVR